MVNYVKFKKYPQAQSSKIPSKIPTSHRINPQIGNTDYETLSASVFMWGCRHWFLRTSRKKLPHFFHPFIWGWWSASSWFPRHWHCYNISVCWKRWKKWDSGLCEVKEIDAYSFTCITGAKRQKDLVITSERSELFPDFWTFPAPWTSQHHETFSASVFTWGRRDWFLRTSRKRLCHSLLPPFHLRLNVDKFLDIDTAKLATTIDLMATTSMSAEKGGRSETVICAKSQKIDSCGFTWIYSCQKAKRSRDTRERTELFPEFWTFLVPWTLQQVQ